MEKNLKKSELQEVRDALEIRLAEVVRLRHMLEREFVSIQKSILDTDVVAEAFRDNPHMVTSLSAGDVLLTSEQREALLRVCEHSYRLDPRTIL